MFVLKYLMGSLQSYINYTFGNEVKAPAGIVSNWVIYDGTSKDSSQEVSIFTFDKSGAPENRLAAARNALKRFKTLRHPCVVRCLDAAENDRVIYVVTERVTFISLGNKFTQDQLILGLYQIASAVGFLNCANLVHCNVSPAAVFVDKAGNWKLAGFECVSDTNEGITTASANADLIPAHYQSPQIARGEWTSLPKDSLVGLDSWSYGCLLFDAFHNGQLSRRDQLTAPTQIPPPVLSDYKRLMASMPKGRLPCSHLIEQRWMGGNELVMAFRFLEGLALKTDQEKDAFFTALSPKLAAFPKDTCKYQLLPLITGALSFGSGTNSRVLACALRIGKQLSTDEYNKLVLPSVLSLFASKQRTVRINLLQHLSEFADALDSSLVSDQILAHVVTGFTDTSAVLRELTVKSMLHFVPKLPEASISSQVLPYLAKLQGDPEPAIRTNTTICLGKIASYLSPATQKRILVSAFSRALRDSFPPARAVALLSFSATAEMYTSEQVAQQIVPVIAPFAIDPSKQVREAALRTLTSFVTRLSNISAKMDDSTPAPSPPPLTSSSAAVAVAAGAPTQAELASAAAAGGGDSSSFLTQFPPSSSAPAPAPSSSPAPRQPSAPAPAPAARGDSDWSDAFFNDLKQAAAKGDEDGEITEINVGLDLGTRKPSHSPAPTGAAPSAISPSAISAPPPSKPVTELDAWGFDESIIPPAAAAAAEPLSLSTSRPGPSSARPSLPSSSSGAGLGARAPAPAIPPPSSTGWEDFMTPAAPAMQPSSRPAAPPVQSFFPAPPPPAAAVVPSLAGQQRPMTSTNAALDSLFRPPAAAPAATNPMDLFGASRHAPPSAAAPAAGKKAVPSIFDPPPPASSSAPGHSAKNSGSNSWDDFDKW